ncbi:MAG: 4-carboxymuconolactone decarboxylase [Pseudomonadota bacterium]
MTSRYEKGMETRRAVLGEAHVDRAEAEMTEFDAPFQTLITEAAWGQVWAGESLTHRDRSLITLALLAAAGHWQEFQMHIRATARTGATPQEVREALLHVALYAGLPAANRALRLAKESYAEMGQTV